MKFFVICFLSILFLSCAKEPNHSLRIANLTQQKIMITLHDSISYELESMEKTQYRKVEEGAQYITGDYTATVHVLGKGTYRWTVNIFKDSVALQRDK